MLACSLSLPHQGLADTILVGSNLSTASQGGADLCPQVSGCSIRAEQFTLSSTVVIDDVQVSLSSGPGQSSNGSFSLGLGSELGGSSTLIGSGNLVFSPNQSPTSELFDFNNLNITLGPGTYYIDFSGANDELDYAHPLLTTDGTLGTQFACDPTEQVCSASSSWDTESNAFGPYAVDLNGTAVTSDAVKLNRTAVTPEPSTLILSATGILALLAVSRRKLSKNLEAIRISREQ
jgi:hypothetical protein